MRARSSCAGLRIILLIGMPADHPIGDLEAFERAVTVGVRYAERGAIVTLGVQPGRADSGYGYIKRVRTLMDQLEKLNASSRSPRLTANILHSANTIGTSESLSACKHVAFDLATDATRDARHCDNDLEFDA
jgi:hypothetical protein